MDIKLGQCKKENRQTEHVKESALYAREILEKFNIEPSLTKILINCVEAHHGKVPFESKEAEVVANADCYRFIHPQGVMVFYESCIKKEANFETALLQVKTKLDEKYKILTLKQAKKDLLKYYSWFSEIIEKSLLNF